MEIIIFDFLETTCYSAERRASSGVLLPLLTPPSALGGTESDTSSDTLWLKKNMLTAYVEYFERTTVRN